MAIATATTAAALKFLRPLRDPDGASLATWFRLPVILAFAVGAELGGVIGALIALPFAAIYPAIEDI